MFKQNIFFIFFKGITLLILFGVSVLLMAINIPTPFGKREETSFFHIKQNTLNAKSIPVKDDKWCNEEMQQYSVDADKEPSDANKEDVWDFLRCRDGFKEEWKEDYTSWLDLIKKRKPQQTFWDNYNSAIDLKPLWNVDPTADYATLSLEVKKVLSNLAKKPESLFILDQVLEFTFQHFSFAKEKYGAVYRLTKMLKANNRWKDLKKYNIEKIQNVNIKPLFSLPKSERDKKTYDEFSEPIKISLRHLLDLDVRSSTVFDMRSVPAFMLIFRHIISINQILAALATRLDNIITKAKIDAMNAAWVFLKTSNRLKNLKKYNINQIGNLQLLLLLFLDDDLEKEYIALTIAQKTLLYYLSKVASYQLTINEQILAKKNSSIELLPEQNQTPLSDVWKFLEENNRLQFLQTNKVWKTNNFDLSSLAKTKLNTKYEDLTLKQNQTLYALSQLEGYEAKIDLHITNHKTGKTTWSFLKVNNRLTNLQIYRIEKIDDINLLSFLENISSETLYGDLTSNQKNFLISLSEISVYNSKIDNKIHSAQTVASNAWTFLTTEDRLANLKKYDIKTIDKVELLPLFANVALTTKYEDLTNDEKSKLNILRKIINYQRSINALIKKNKDSETAWAFLKTSNRLANLKKHEIKTIKKVILLPVFQNVATSTPYENLTDAQQTIIYDLSQVTNYQKAINDAIQNSQNTIAADAAWTFLQTNNRLQQLQTKKVLKTSNFDLSILAKIKPSTKYKNLTPKQKTALYHLSKLKNYQNTIKKVLVNSSKKTTEDSSNLLWLWIALPSVFTFLIFGFGFYFYRFKKLSISKLKKHQK